MPRSGPDQPVDLTDDMVRRRQRAELCAETDPATGGGQRRDTGEPVETVGLAGGGPAVDAATRGPAITLHETPFGIALLPHRVEGREVEQRGRVAVQDRPAVPVRRPSPLG